jgi:hypothetical protein
MGMKRQPYPSKLFHSTLPQNLCKGNWTARCSAGRTQDRTSTVVPVALLPLPEAWGAAAGEGEGAAAAGGGAGAAAAAGGDGTEAACGICMKFPFIVLCLCFLWE